MVDLLHQPPRERVAGVTDNRGGGPFRGRGVGLDISPSSCVTGSTIELDGPAPHSDKDRHSATSIPIARTTVNVPEGQQPAPLCPCPGASTPQDAKTSNHSMDRAVRRRSIRGDDGAGGSSLCSRAQRTRRQDRDCSASRTSRTRRGHILRDYVGSNSPQPERPRLLPRARRRRRFTATENLQRTYGGAASPLLFAKRRKRCSQPSERRGTQI
jgi:hypothetical protein